MKALKHSPMVRCLLALLCVGMLCAGLFLLEKGGMVWDVSPAMLTRLSEGTLHTLSSLEEEVHLHLVFKPGSESSLRQMLTTLADSYAREGRVLVDTIDPVTEPGRIRAFAEAGRSIAEGSVIVTNANESRSEVIAASDLYTYQMTASGSYAITGFSAEQKITAAIRSVTGGERRQVWFLTGHEEAGMADCTQLVSRLQRENYDVDELPLSQPELLQGGDILLMLSPTRDLTDEEAKAKKYGGGVTMYYFKEMGEHPAPDYLAKTTKPMLILQGEADFQVKADRDFLQYKELLGDRDNVTFRLYPGLNHCFVPTLGMNIANAKKEYSKERHIPAEVLDDIAGWIRQNQK